MFCSARISSWTTAFPIYNIHKRHSTCRRETHQLLKSICGWLGHHVLFKVRGHVNNRIKIYLESLVSWIFKWRLKMNASKCCYTIFSSSGNRSKIKFVCKLKDGLIPYNPNPLFLGITLDEYLNFKSHTDNLRQKAIKRLNIIKIFSHKSWKLSHETLKCIYGALIGSLFTYSFFSVARIATSNLERLQRV